MFHPFAIPCTVFDETQFVKVSLGLQGISHCFLPLHPGEEHLFANDRAKVREAARHERRLFETVAKNREWPPLLDAVKQAAVVRYIQSHYVLLTHMFEANQRRRMGNRLSLRQLVMFASMHKVFEALNEPATIIDIPKPDGSNRATLDFGPVARGAQRMCKKILKLHYQLAPFQFSNQGAIAPVEKAIELVTEGGFTHVTQLDITKHYDSFDREMLKASLPLPENATHHIICASDAMLIQSGGTHSSFNDISHPLGLPQGGLASSSVAEWSISKLNMQLGQDLILLNYADNFFLFAKSQKDLDAGQIALSAAIANLPGGCFKTKCKYSGPCAAGFDMLGFFISRPDGKLLVTLDADRAGDFWQRFVYISSAAKQNLTQHAKTGGKSERLKGVALIWQLRAMLKNWQERVAICTVGLDGASSEMSAQIAELTVAFDISNHELKAAFDPFCKSWAAPEKYS